MSAAANVQELLRRHPLQRLESPSMGFSATLHIISLASFAYSFRYLAITPNPVNDAYGWHMMYLTILAMALASFAMFFGLLADITGSRTLFRVKNALVYIGAPMEVLVSFLYWGLRAIDSSLVLPDWAPRLDHLTDFSFHLFPALYLSIDLLLLSPPREISLRSFLFISMGIAVSYWWWVELCYSHNGFYPYPIFGQLDTPARIGLFTFSAVAMTVVGSALGGLYAVLNGVITP